MANSKISALTSATTPLAGTEVLPVVQSSATTQVTVANLTAGRAVSALSLTSTNDATINGLTVGKGAGAITTNTTVGAGALNANVSGGSIVAYGYHALINNTGGSNSGVGADALALNVGGVLNTGMGTSVLFSNVSGQNNTALGASAGYTVKSSNNSLLGYRSGYGITTGGKNVIIGSYEGSAAPISATGSNYVVLSDGDGNVRAYFNGSIGIFNGTISPVQATTAGAPAYVKGAIYFDTTLNKLRIGGATAWETVTSV